MMKKNIMLIAAAAVALLAASCQNNETETPLKAEFTSDVTSALVGDEVTFDDCSTGKPSTWDWTFEGAETPTSVLTQPKVTWMTPGTYTVTLKVGKKGESDQVAKTGFITINYHSEVKALFTFDKTRLFEDETISFTNNSEGYPESVKWTFTPATGEPIYSTEYSPALQLPVGKYSVKLEVSNPIASDSMEVTDAFEVVDRYAVIVELGAKNQTTYAGGKVYFVNKSVGNVQGCEWTFEGGTPSTSTEMDPVVTYENEGTYKVSLKVYNDRYTEYDTKEGYIHVIPAGDLLFLLPFDGDYNDYGPYGLHPSTFTLGDLTLGYSTGHDAQPYGQSLSLPGGTKAVNYCVLRMPDTQLAEVFPNGSDFTISVWTKLASISANNAIFAMGDCPGSPNASNQSWARFQSGGVLRFMVECTGKASNSITTPTTKPLDDSQWHNVAMVYQAVNGKRNSYIYVDGTLLTSATGKDDKETTTVPYFIGCNLRFTNNAYAPENIYLGDMDNYTVYKRALTAAEIANLIKY